MWSRRYVGLDVAYTCGSYFPSVHGRLSWWLGISRFVGIWRGLCDKGARVWAILQVAESWSSMDSLFNIFYMFLLFKKLFFLSVWD